MTLSEESDYRSWLQSKRVITDFFLELFPSMSQKNPDFPDETIAEHNAAAIIARLASHNPPLIICTSDVVDSLPTNGCYQVRFRRPDKTEAWLGRSGCGPTDDRNRSPMVSLSEAQLLAGERNRVHGPSGYRYWVVPADTDADAVEKPQS